jgi:hypothetical protein
MDGRKDYFVNVPVKKGVFFGEVKNPYSLINYRLCLYIKKATLFEISHT